MLRYAREAREQANGCWAGSPTTGKGMDLRVVSCAAQRSGPWKKARPHGKRGPSPCKLRAGGTCCPPRPGSQDRHGVSCTTLRSPVCTTGFCTVHDSGVNGGLERSLGDDQREDAVQEGSWEGQKLQTSQAERLQGREARTEVQHGPGAEREPGPCGGQAGLGQADHRATAVLGWEVPPTGTKGRCFPEGQVLATLSLRQRRPV